MCLHTHTVLLDNYFTCCCECGKMLEQIYEPSKMQMYNDFTKENLVVPYTRIKRFRYLYDSVVFGFQHTDDRKMLRLLSTQKDTIHEVKDIIKIMVSSNLIDKRYCSLHLFMKCFLPNRLFITSEHVSRFAKKQKLFEQAFKEIEYKLAVAGRKFLNYRFVLDVLLHFFELDEFRMFLKPLKCQKRLSKNINTLNSCRAQITGDTALVISDTFRMSPRSLFVPGGHRCQTLSP